jgi:hypothetical protein
VSGSQVAGSLTEAESGRETVSQKRSRPVDDPSKTSRAYPKKFWPSITKTFRPSPKKFWSSITKSFGRPSPKSLGAHQKKNFSVH